MNFPVTLIIPVYGVEKYIERCAVSLFEQTFSPIEYIFVDDASPDRSIEILDRLLARYPARRDAVKIIRHQQNAGLAAARLTGLQQASGEYVMHVDSDDWLDLHAVKKLYHAIQNTDADAAICNYRQFSEGRTIDVSRNVDDDHTIFIQSLLRGHTPSSIWGILLRKEYALRPDALPIPGINHGEDAVTTPRMLYYAKKIIHLAQPLYFYERQNQNSYTNRATADIIEQRKHIENVLHAFFQDKDGGVFRNALGNQRVLTLCILLVLAQKFHFSDQDVERIFENFPVTKEDCRGIGFHHRLIVWGTKFPRLQLWRAAIDAIHLIQLMIGAKK